MPDYECQSCGESNAEAVVTTEYFQKEVAALRAELAEAKAAAGRVHTERERLIGILNSGMRLAGLDPTVPAGPGAGEGEEPR